MESLIPVTPPCVVKADAGSRWLRSNANVQLCSEKAHGFVEEGVTVWHGHGGLL